MICARCGQENPEGFRFCGACGAELESAPAAGEVRKVVTVLFCDVAGFTSVGERLDPEALRRLQVRYFDEARTALERHGATVEKFIGDAVLAVFGIPRAHEDDALRAVRASVELRAAVKALGLEPRIGINTGEVVAGSGEALVTGDAVNVAARLEQAAEPGEILIGPLTEDLVRDAAGSEPLAPLTLPGREAEVGAFRLLRVAGEAVAIRRNLDAPLVGRTNELRLLRDAFARVVDERSCHLVTILGPAGIGKSRLGAELERTIEHEADALHGRCLSYGEGITFWPLTEIFSEAAADEELARALDAPSVQETFWAVRTFLERRAAERPQVIVFDDIHWAEATLLDLIDHIADWSRDAPLLLLCLARPDLLDERPSWGGGKRNATSLFLEPLTYEESAALMEELLTHPALSGELRTRVAEAAGGNPLFVEQMLALAVERDAGNGDLEVPPSIQALLTARLDTLAPDERTVLQRASVVGKQFGRADVAELLPARLRPQVAAQLLTLVRKDLVRPGAADEFRFRHDLIRDAAYDALPKEQRAELHERFADVVEATFGERLAELDEILGYHVEQAHAYRLELGADDQHAEGLARRAAEHLASAGRAAVARGDSFTAANLMRRAAGLLPAQDPVRIDLLLELEAALVAIGELSAAEDVVDEALAAAREIGDRRLGLHAEIARESVLVLTEPEGAADRMKVVAEEAISLFDELEDDLGLARAWWLLGDVGWMHCRFGESATALEHAVEFFARAGDHRRKARSTWRLGASWVTGPTPIAEALVRCREMVAWAEGDRLTEATMLVPIALGEAYSGNIQRAREIVERQEAILDEFGLRLAIAASRDLAAKVDAFAGDLEAAERAWRESCAMFIEMGERGFLSTRAAELAELALYPLGKYDEAERYAELGRETGASDDIETQARWRGALAKVLARRGEHEAAERLAAEGVELTNGTDFPELQGDVLMDAAEVFRVAARPDVAVGFAGRALEVYEAKGIVPSAREARAFLEDVGADVH